MIEYLYDAIRATTGSDITIVAVVTEDDETLEGTCLALHTKEDAMVMIEGELVDGVYQFTIPAEVTAGLSGRYSYCFMKEGQPLCFKKPIYFV